MNKESTEENVTVLPKKPERTLLCTYPLYRFLRRYELIFDFFFFSVRLATTIDRNRKVAAAALAATEAHDEVKKLEYDRIKDGEDLAFKELKRFASFQSENICIRTSDNFMSFISESIKSAMLERPEMLRSNETVKIEDVMRFTDYDSLTAWLVEKKINELMYAGIKGIEGFLSERTGLKIADSDEEHCLLSICIELRNVYTHNRGHVNEMFLKRIPKYKHSFHFEEGEYYHADFDELAELSNNTLVLATHLDERIAKKYDIARKAYSSWIDESEKK